MSLLLAPIHARPRASSEIEQLRADNRELRRKVEALQAFAFGSEGDALVIPMPRRETVLFRALMRHARVTVEQCIAALEAAIPSQDGKSPENIHCPMSILRRFLRQHSVEIHNARHQGYWITPADKARLRELFRA